MKLIKFLCWLGIGLSILVFMLPPYTGLYAWTMDVLAFVAIVFNITNLISIDKRIEQEKEHDADL